MTYQNPNPYPDGGYNGPPWQNQPPVNPERNGLGLTALILAVVGLVFGFVPLTGFIAFILGAIALILGIAGRSRVKKNKATNGKTAIAGIVLGLAALALGIWGMVIFFTALGDLGDGLDCISNADTSAQIEACN